MYHLGKRFNLRLGGAAVAFNICDSFPDHFELNSALFVIGYVGQDVILPCQSSSGALPQNVEVQWKKTVDDNTENIYQFTAFTGQETFGQGYESRAVFATEGLDTGNVSLMLKMAQKSDEGSYSCIVKTKDWGAQTQTVLVVESSKESYSSIFHSWLQIKISNRVFYSGSALRCQAKLDFLMIPPDPLPHISRKKKKDYFQKTEHCRKKKVRLKENRKLQKEKGLQYYKKTENCRKKKSSERPVPSDLTWSSTQSQLPHNRKCPELGKVFQTQEIFLSFFTTVIC
ncbi:butyrophilin subfamily 3 member A1-like [Podarcis lilfordi]|uniref:Butyrophilin subfamily 3 member A1-like n=1 Tax=Podarcis lilfordi TaxID=74358 RepID=A0AA35L648_9SAUR|nr:butyrophilin subfamily 3 member A1-like [Podarcis lilfordi]